MADLYSLNWNNYKSSMTNSLKTIIQEEDFVDVTLHSEGKFLKAHKVYLSASSDYFKSVLKNTNFWQQPILFLSEVPYHDLQSILEFIYCSEVQVPQNRLQSFMKSAEILKINGLIDQIPHSSENIPDQSYFSKLPKKKRRKKDSIDAKEESTNLIAAEAASEQNTNCVEEHHIDNTEEVIVKADPEDFQSEELCTGMNNDEIDFGSNRGIVVRNDLMLAEGVHLSQGPMYGERGRCHFCSLLCPDRSSLTEHLTKAHQPPKHSLCENCENFFHICAIQRHRQKCKARYQTDK